jgi:hypothetical protein
LEYTRKKVNPGKKKGMKVVQIFLSLGLENNTVFTSCELTQNITLTGTLRKNRINIPRKSQYVKALASEKPRMGGK